MTIRANHITILRIALLPLPYFLLYKGTLGRVAAILVFAVLGLTDYFDGVLARRYGVTPLGKLLDPIADKIFMAVIMVCLVDLQILPYWLVLPIFMRESLVAEIRGNGISLEVTELAKIKTAIQMGASGVMLLLDTYRNKVVLASFLSGALISTVFLAVALFVRDGDLSQRMRWALILLGLALFLCILLPPKGIYLSYGFITVAITLVSGGQYFLKGLPALFARGTVPVLKTLMACLFPIIPVYLIPFTPHRALWALILLLSMEYAIEGLDTLSLQSGGMDLSGLKTILIMPLVLVVLALGSSKSWMPGLDISGGLFVSVWIYGTYFIVDLILNKDIVFNRL